MVRSQSSLLFLACSPISSVSTNQPPDRLPTFCVCQPPINSPVCSAAGRSAYKGVRHVLDQDVDRVLGFGPGVNLFVLKFLCCQSLPTRAEPASRKANPHYIMSIIRKNLSVLFVRIFKFFLLTKQSDLDNA